MTPAFHGDDIRTIHRVFLAYICMCPLMLSALYNIYTHLQITSPLLTLHHFSPSHSPSLLTHSLTHFPLQLHTYFLTQHMSSTTNTYTYIYKRLGHILKKIHVISPLRAMKILEKQIDLQSCRYCTMPEHFPKPRCLHQS